MCRLGAEVNNPMSCSLFVSHVGQHAHPSSEATTLRLGWDLTS